MDSQGDSWTTWESPSSIIYHVQFILYVILESYLKIHVLLAPVESAVASQFKYTALFETEWLFNDCFEYS